MRLFRFMGGGFAVLALAASVGHAELVELTVTGTIANSTYDGRDFDEGDPFTVVLTIDTDTPVNPSPAATGTTTYYSNAVKKVRVTSLLYDTTYENPAGMGRVVLTDNGLAGQDLFRFQLRGDGTFFNYNTQSAWQPGTTTPLPNAGYLDDLYVNDLTPGPEQFKYLLVDLGTFDTGFITDGKLPATFSGFAFDQKQAFNITGRAGNSGVSDLTLAVSSAIVPEPASLVLLALGGLCVRRRHR
jgi:hypothetical protein